MPNHLQLTGPTINDHEVKLLRERDGTSVRAQRNRAGLPGPIGPLTEKIDQGELGPTR